MDHDDSDPANGQYNDTNRAFLQAFLARGALSLMEGKALLAAIFTANEGTETRVEDVTEEDFNSYISAAADAISPYDYEIRSAQHQATKKRTFALVNSNSDALTQLATTQTPEEILYIRRLLDGMFDGLNRKGKEVMAITGMQAGQSAIRKGSGKQIIGDGTQSIDKGVTQDQVEKLLVQLVNENWLERSKAGFYSLSPRALMELRNWLVITYNEDEAEPNEWQRIKFCEACKDVITVGQRCSNLECNVRLHNICEAAYFNSRPAKKCPRCKTAWAGNRYVGEKAITTTDDYLKGKRRSGVAARARDEQVEEEEEEPAGRKRKGGRAPQTRETASEDEEEEEEEEEQPGPSALRKRSRRAREDSSEDEDAAGKRMTENDLMRHELRNEGMKETHGFPIYRRRSKARIF